MRKVRITAHAQSYGDIGGYECYPDCVECKKSWFKDYIRGMVERWETPRQPTYAIHPRQSWMGWVMGQRWWAFKQWVSTLYSLNLTWDEWWGDRPWQ